MAPETTGVDMEVPLFVVYPLFVEQLIILSPGTTISGFWILQCVGPLPEKRDEPVFDEFFQPHEPIVITLRLIPGIVMER